MPPQSPPPQEFARVILIIIFVLYLYTSPDQGPPPGFPSPHDYAAARIARSRHALDVLNTSKWQDFLPVTANGPTIETAKYINLTGFREDDGMAWWRLDSYKERARLFSQEAKGTWRHGKDNDSGLEGEVYENVTGIVTGRWVRYTGDLNGRQETGRMNLSAIAPSTDWAFRDEELWTRNITGKEGKLMLRINEDGGDEMDFSEKEPVDVQTPAYSSGFIREVGATMTVQDESSSGDGWEMRLHGVHWPRRGLLLMTTTSEKFAGIFGLPQLTPAVDYFLTSQRFLNRTLETKIEKMEKAAWLDSSNPWSSSPESQGDATMPIPHCEFVVYAQLHPAKVALVGANANPAHFIYQIEQDLRQPNGAPLGDVPKLKLSTVIFSPDCGFMLESKGPPTFSPTDGEHLVGRKQEVFLHDVQNWLLLLAAAMFGQILLLKIQSKEASTPSTIGRVSLYTVAWMLMADALIFSSLSLLSATAPDIFPSALIASFTSLMSVALGVRFIGAVYNVQEPERRATQRTEEEQRRNQQTPSNPTTATVPVLPGEAPDPVSLQPAAPAIRESSSDVPVIVPSDQDIDAEIVELANAASAIPRPTLTLPTTAPATTQTQRPQPRGVSFAAIYGQFVLLLTILLFVSLSATSWPVGIRAAYTHILSFFYLSLWLPQIRRNIIRNCRKALLWKFVIGQSVLRLLPFAYFYLKKDNILFAENDWKALCILAGWVWVQIWVLVAQEVLGPRWGLPKNWTEEGWDYHPILREDNVESGGLPVGLVQSPGSPILGRVRTSEDLGSRQKKEGAHRSVDCAICMQVLEVPVVAAGEEASGTGTAGGVTGMLARRQYMVTPCRHIFHSACLEGWMRFRLQCPICRENLPPL